MNFKSILVVLFGFSIFDAALTVKSWGYRSPHLLTPNFWYQEYPTCAGLKQSPINIDPNIAKFSKNLQKIKIKPRGNFKEAWTIVNNAHTIRLSSNKKYEFIIDSQVFSLQQMHFHWRGSEHRINGRKFAGELHLVHTNLNETGKYSVISFLFQVNLYEYN